MSYGGNVYPGAPTSHNLGHSARNDLACEQGRWLSDRTAGKHLEVSSLLLNLNDTQIGRLGGVPRNDRFGQFLTPDDVERDAVRVHYRHAETSSGAVQLSDRRCSLPCVA
jgi:hypothetical protein